MAYTAAFKAQMVKRLMGPAAVTAQSLSKQVGVPQPTLSKWLREATTFGRMRLSDEKPKAVVAGPKSWTAAEKVRVLAAAEGLTGSAVGELLRREGLHEEQLHAWHAAAAEALDGADAGPLGGPRNAVERKQLTAAKKRVKELEKELQRTEKALAKTAALVVLKKKIDEMWAVEDDGTSEGSER